MISVQDHYDALLRQRLESLTESHKDYWSFKGISHRKYSHGLFYYPAMMVPQVARAILNEICAVHPEIETVGDPFVGSGTVLTEVMSRRLDFVGTDINPLAILLCRVKSGPFYIDSLKTKALTINKYIDDDHSRSIDVDFPNRNKWFPPETQIALSRIRRAILKEKSRWARRFFWIGLAEAVRFSSNSRTSTVKLHMRPADEIADRRCDVIGLYRKAILRNLKYFEAQANLLNEIGALKAGRYNGRIDVLFGDTRHIESGCKVDIIITSPPYGDNLSTVTYGQYSYLPLQWLDLADIDPAADSSYLKSTHEIDTRSLGGSRRVSRLKHNDLVDKSPSLNECLSYLESLPPDRVSRVLAFFRDVDACLPVILKSLRPGGLMIWVLGNRNVGNRRVPFSDILSELLTEQGVTILYEFNRRISSKRMALKNSITNTMTKEAILVMRKASK